MIIAVLYLLLFALILGAVYYIAGKFISGKTLLILGCILAVIWLIYLLTYFLPGLTHPVLMR